MDHSYRRLCYLLEKSTYPLIEAQRFLEGETIESYGWTLYVDQSILAKALYDIQKAITNLKPSTQTYRRDPLNQRNLLDSPSEV